MPINNTTGAATNSGDTEVRLLFERKTIQDIRNVEKNTRKEIEQKKQELRLLVGNRYRDLIDSADSIIGMKAASGRLFDKLKAMELQCEAIKLKVRQSQSDTQAEEEALKRRHTYHLAKLVKQLIETPEMIWSSLEGDDLMEATTLYYNAENIYIALKQHANTDPDSPLHRIKVYRREWEIVQQFPPRILVAARQALRKNTFSEVAYAGALSSIMVLEKQPPIVAFKEFLDSRKHTIAAILSGVGQSESYDIIKEALCTLVKTIQSTVVHLYTLFLAPQSPANLYQLLARLENDIEYNKQLIQLHNATSPNLSRQSSSSPSLSGRSPVVIHHPLKGKEISPDVIKAEASKWIEECAQLVKTMGSEVLTKVNTARSLVDLNVALYTPIHAAQRQKVEDANTPLIPNWKELCSLVLNSDVSLWDTFFQEIFLQRSKDIITAAFKSLSIQQHLNDILARQTQSAEENNLGDYIWKDNEQDNVLVTKKKANGMTPYLASLLQHFDAQLDKAASESKLLLDDQNMLTPEMAMFAPQKKKSVGELQKHVAQVCCDSVGVVVDALHHHLTSIHNTFLIASPSDKAMWEHVEEGLLISRVAQSIAAKSDALPKILAPPSDPTASPLPAHLPPKTQRILSKYTSNLRLDGRSESSQLYRKVQDQLRSVYLYGSLLWARAIGRSLPNRLADDLAKQNWADPLRRKTWEAVPIPVSVEDGEDTGKGESEEIIYLPYQASAFVLSFLLSVSNHINRVGPHIIDKGVVQYMVQELSGGVYNVYRNFVSSARESSTTTSLSSLSSSQSTTPSSALPSGGSSGALATSDSNGSIAAQIMNREGIVQILLDARLLFDVLAARNYSEDTLVCEVLRKIRVNDLKFAGQATDNVDIELPNQAAWKKKINQLITDIQDELDPIDFAFYENHVKSTVARIYHRSSLLFGSLIQLNRHPIDPSAVKSSSARQEQHNILLLSSGVPRFTYLPITASTPTTPTVPDHVPHALSSVAETPQSEAATQPAAKGAPSRPLSMGFMELGRKFTESLPIGSMLSDTSPKPGSSSHQRTGSRGIFNFLA